MGIVQKVKQGMADTWAKVFGAPEKFFGREAAHRSLEDAFDIPGHLMEVVRQSYRDMDYVRKSHKSAVQQFVGRLRAGDDTKVVPIPKLRQMVRVYTRLLSSGEPQARISTIHPEYRAFAKNLELHTNRQLVECNLEEAFRAAVLQSMFSVGCLKTGLASGMPDGDGVFEFEGVLYDAGKPFSKSVHINNLVLDMQAENGDALSFIGDRYYLPECVLMKIEEKDWEGAAEVMRQSQMAGEDRASGVIESADKRLYKSRLCWDIYLPMQNAVVMYADGSDHPLDV